MLRTLAVVGAVLAVTSSPAVAQQPAAVDVPSAAASSWTPPLTPDGQPDMQGNWSSATYTPLERPEELGDKAFFTREEAEAFVKRRLAALANQREDDIHYDNAIWQSEKDQKGLSSLRTSLIVDPPTGRIPPLLPEAQQRAAARAAARKAMGPADSVQSRALSERCIIWPHEGPPMLPVGYNSNLQIVQGPGYVVVVQEMIHNARVIPLDGQPHIGPAIKQYGGDSRGHWENGTLVVETTNFTDKTAFRGSSSALRVTERFTPTDPDTILYKFTVEDPTTWATPWSAEYPITRSDETLYEYACHEGNYGLANILRAQRLADEQAAQQAQKQH